MFASPDNEEPDIGSCPSNIIKDNDPGLSTAMVTWTDPEAQDNSGQVTVSCSPNSGSNFDIGNTEVECEAVDESGNKNDCVFTITVQGKLASSVKKQLSSYSKLRLQAYQVEIFVIIFVVIWW